MKTQQKAGIWQRFMLWQGTYKARVEMDQVSDRTLKDIGLARDCEGFPIKMFF
jgi:uncharacterized protein YjiS (DUF1127 family)